MRVAILPSGALLLDASVDDDGLSAAARSRLARAFERGPGHALLDLGAIELDAALAPDLAFLRDVGRAFVTRLRGVPELEERRERVEVDAQGSGGKDRHHGRRSGDVPGVAADERAHLGQELLLAVGALP